jgi:hypothetical protein
MSIVEEADRHVNDDQIIMSDPESQILAQAIEMTGSRAYAEFWLRHQPIPAWNGKTAQNLLSEGKADQVLAYLDAVKAGVYA